MTKGGVKGLTSVLESIKGNMPESTIEAQENIPTG